MPHRVLEDGKTRRIYNQLCRRLYNLRLYYLQKMLSCRRVFVSNVQRPFPSDEHQGSVAYEYSHLFQALFQRGISPRYRLCHLMRCSVEPVPILANFLFG